jgi:glutamyl-tRNA(Gln) amidotransferase subunit D
MNKKLKLKFKDTILEGVLINENENYLTLKLKSGYNVILDKNNIEIISSENFEINKSKIYLEIKRDKNKKNILLIHTGGTIASKVDYRTGAVSSKYSPEELLSAFPELLDKVNFDVDMIGNLFSEDMRFAYINRILKSIETNLKEKSYDGIIITHGTDTMHYTSAGLSYCLNNLKIPVILVGAQRSSDRPSSDAFSNLNAAVDFIIKNYEDNLIYNRVGICMHYTLNDDEFYIIDGINAKKAHSSRRDAFKQINFKLVSKLDYDLKTFSLEYIEYFRKDLFNQESNEKFNVEYLNENIKVGFFKAHPNLFPEEIKALSIYDGVIIEGTGLGHVAINVIDQDSEIHKQNFKELSSLIEKMPLIMATQTVEGPVNLNVYSTGRDLDKLGIIWNKNYLSSETLFMRLVYTLGKYKYNSKDWRKLWDSDLEKLGVVKFND